MLERRSNIPMDAFGFGLPLSLIDTIVIRLQQLVSRIHINNYRWGDEVPYVHHLVRVGEFAKELTGCPSAEAFGLAHELMDRDIIGPDPMKIDHLQEQLSSGNQDKNPDPLGYKEALLLFLQTLSRVVPIRGTYKVKKRLDIVTTLLKSSEELSPLTVILLVIDWVEIWDFCNSHVDDKALIKRHLTYAKTVLTAAETRRGADPTLDKALDWVNARMSPPKEDPKKPKEERPVDPEVEKLKLLRPEWFQQ